VDADACLRQLEDEWGQDSTYQIGALHAQRGDLDAAIAWFDRGVAQRDAGMALVQSESILLPLHSDPRWETRLKKIGFAS
jgi:hypothetical protein